MAAKVSFHLAAATMSLATLCLAMLAVHPMHADALQEERTQQQPQASIIVAGRKKVPIMKKVEDAIHKAMIEASHELKKVEPELKHRTKKAEALIEARSTRPFLVRLHSRIGGFFPNNYQGSSFLSSYYIFTLQHPSNSARDGVPTF